MVELLELTLDLAVAPARVVSGHANDQCANRNHDAGPADSIVGVRPLGGDQLAVPPHDCVGRYDRRDAAEQAATEHLALCREPAPLVIGQTKALATELFLEDPVLLDQVVDGLGLVAVDPAGEGGEKELKGEGVGHVTPIIGVLSERRKSGV